MFIVHVISCYLLAAMIRTMIPAQDLDTVDAYGPYLTLPRTASASSADRHSGPAVAHVKE